LFIAKGSCGEVRSMLYLAFELKYLNEEEYKFLLNSSTEISKIISGLIKTLN
jgi:four helix bundle protein